MNRATRHNNDTSAQLARSITFTGSKQTYFTGRLMVDQDLVDDFYRAYAYFRWADDIVDEASASEVDNPTLSEDEQIIFIRRQRALIESLYRGERLENLVPEEEMLADLIRHDTGANSGLQSFIYNMFAIIEFDAHRRGRLISEDELNWYTRTLSKSVTDGLQYFVGNGHDYPGSEYRLSAAHAAHITHLLRDMLADTQDGFINIPREVLQAHKITPMDVETPAYREWVKNRVQLARGQFSQGKCYLDELIVLRTKIVGYWYCRRFESILDSIEADGFILRREYDERRKISTWISIAWLGLSVSLRHFACRVFRIGCKKPVKQD